MSRLTKWVVYLVLSLITAPILGYLVSKKGPDAAAADGEKYLPWWDLCLNLDQILFPPERKKE